MIGRWGGCGDAFGDQFVEAMDPLDHQDLSFSHDHPTRFFAAAAVDEIVDRRFCDISFDKTFDIVIQPFQINALDGFKIIVAVFIQRCFVPAEKIIVGGKGNGFDAVDLEEHTEFVRKCGFP